jgi:hypothetical protein
MGKEGDTKDSPVRFVEKDHFTHAKCECGWRGPGRRSRKKARADAEAHLADTCKATRK